jgi:hypothetical protein
LNHSLTRHNKEGVPVEPLPDLGSLSDEELKKLKDDLEKEEREVSYRRRILHGKIDILRAELVVRLQRSGGRSVLDELDVARLSEILSGKSSPGGKSSPEG